MKTILVFKWARDPQDARMSIDGTLTWGNAKMAASDDDPAAMSVAQALSPEEDVTALTIGNGDGVWAAARGASSTVMVEDALDCSDASRTASVIKAAIDRAGGADAVVIGDSDWNKGVVVSLMAELQIPAFAGVVAAEKTGETCRISCKSGSVTKVIEAKPPFLLAVRGLSAEKTVPGMKQVLQARKKPQEKIKVSDLSSVRRTTVEDRGTGLPDSGTATMIDGSDPSAAARELVDTLKKQGVL